MPTANPANLVYTNNMGDHNGVRFYDYTTSDTLADVEQIDPNDGQMSIYFANCGDKLRTYDFIRVTASDGKRLLWVGLGTIGFVTTHKIATVTTFF